MDHDKRIDKSVPFVAVNIALDIFKEQNICFQNKAIKHHGKTIKTILKIGLTLNIINFKIHR